MSGKSLGASLLASFVASSVLACGGSPPPPVEAPPPPEPVHTAPPPPIMATQELGSIDEKATNHTFDGLSNQFLDCQRQGMTRVEFLAGDAKFFIRVGQDGMARWAFLEDSTIGDRATEKCVLQVVSNAHWPKPEGGEAEVQKSISFDVGDARPATAWTSDKVSGVLAKDGADALKCKEKVRGVYKVTAYVEPGDERKHKHGKVLAVGVAPPNKDGDAKSDCIADAVMGWKMPSPGGYAAKVTFSL